MVTYKIGDGEKCGSGSAPEGLAIMFSEALEDHSPGRGVDSHGKGLGGEQHLDEASAEQHLHHLLHDRQQPCMATVHHLLPACQGVMLAVYHNLLFVTLMVC